MWWGAIAPWVGVLIGSQRPVGVWFRSTLVEGGRVMAQSVVVALMVADAELMLSYEIPLL